MIETTIRDKYFNLLRSHFANPQEDYLAQAAELGRELVMANIPPEEIAELHEDALQRLGAEFPDAKLIGAANLISQPLMELLMAYGMAFREQLDERKRAEETLREERDKAQNYLDVAEVMFVIIGADQKVTLVNNTCCGILGYKEEGIIGKNWFDNFIPERIKDEVKTFFQKLMAGEIEAAEYFENPVLTKSGEERIIAWCNTLLRDKAGNIIGTLSSGEDITERKRMEEALRESEGRFRALAESTSDWIWEVDENAVYTYTSPKIKELLGYEPEEIIGKTPFDLMTLEGVKRVAAEFGAIAEAQKLFDRLENENLHKDGRILVLETSGVPIFDANGNFRGYRGIDRDITERKRAEEQITASLKEKEVLLREIHHRVKNNLQVVSSLLNMQARATKNKDTLDILSESRNRLNAMALIHSQLYEGGNLSEINMKGFMDKLVVQLLQIYSVPETKITPVVHAVECSLPISTAVPVGLIANELLTNAFKHAFVNRKEGKIEVNLRASEKGVVDLTVSDDGVGLPEGFVINTSKTLGLSVVKILAEDQLDGKLEVVSDKGTTCKVEFEMAEGL
jgi:PAS domain S-box-containing protein